MKIIELFKFIDKQDKKLLKYFPNKTLQEEILSRMTKLTEEVGELAGEVLASKGSQRKEKLKNHSKESLEGEFADVLITTLLLAKTMKVGIEDALEKKIVKINDRFEKIAKESQY